MKIKYIGKGSYYHHPYLFHKVKNTHNVEEDIGIALLEQPKLFQKIAEPKKKETPEEETKESDDVNHAEPEEEIKKEASEQKKLYDESKEEVKKKSTKKDK